MKKKCKTLKKYLVFVLALAFICSTAVTPISAGEIRSMQESSVINLLAGFLEKNAFNNYMYDDKDITDYLISDETAEQIDAFAVKQTRDSTVLSEFSVEPQLARFLQDKTAYAQYVRRAEGIERRDFAVAYQAEDISLQGDTAVVKMRETATFQYTDAEYDSVISSVYTISLVKLDGSWMITDLTSDDSFSETYADKDFDLAAAIAAYEDQKINGVFEAPENERLIAPTAVGSIPYDRASAAAYAITYALSYNQPLYGNWGYPHGGGDCQNFASQCIWAGFGGSNTSADVSGRARPMDTMGSWQWYKDSGAWLGTESFKNYVAGSKNESEQNDRLWITEYHCAKSRIGEINNARTRLIGATVQDSPNQNHTVVIVAVEGLTPASIYVCGHTSDVKYVKLSDGLTTSGNVFVLVPETMYTYESGATALRVRASWLWEMNVNTTTTLSASTNQNVFRMAMKVTAPNGAVTWLGEVENTSSYRKTYTFTQRGLYHITIEARNVPEGTSGSMKVSNTVSVRIK